MEKLWKGRFSKEVDKAVNSYNSSISFDERLFFEDITGSIAHVKMLAKCGIIENAEKDALVNMLQSILSEIEKGQLAIDSEAEDIHTFIEAELTKRLPKEGKKLHTARSRNDQVALDMRLWVIKTIDGLVFELAKFVNTLCEVASKHKSSIMSGYTHLQKAQPVSFGHYMMAYCAMLLRDIDRLKDVKKRTNVNPLGCGALATTTYDIDRFYTTELLGMSEPCQNSLDGVSDRDYCVEFLSALSLIMVHLSRFGEEIILWSSWEFKYIELDDAYATGSSIMPQKKNPDVAELARGKSGRVFGDLNTLLVVLKGIPLAYNKDMQEDKEAVFDAADTVLATVGVFTDMVKTMTVNTAKMRKSAEEGFINATDCADYLVKKGFAFRDAYKIVGELVAYCIKNSKTLESLDMAGYKSICNDFDEGVYEAVKLENCVKNRKAYGGPSEQSVQSQIEYTQQKIAEFIKEL